MNTNFEGTSKLINNECFGLQLDISQIFPRALEGINFNGMLRRCHFLITFIVSKIESFYSNKIQTKLYWTPLQKHDVATSTGPDSPVILQLVCTIFLNLLS